MEQDEQGGCLNCKEKVDLRDRLRKIKHSRWLGRDIFGGMMAPSPGATLVSFVAMHTFVFWPHRHGGIEQDPGERTVVANSGLSHFILPCYSWFLSSILFCLATHYSQELKARSDHVCLIFSINYNVFKPPRLTRHLGGGRARFFSPALLSSQALETIRDWDKETQPESQKKSSMLGFEHI